MFVCCECCVLSGRSLCDKLITRPEEVYAPWYVVVCDLETSWMRRPWPTGGGCLSNNKQTNKHNILYELVPILHSVFPNCSALTQSSTPCFFPSFILKWFCEEEETELAQQLLRPNIRIRWKFSIFNFNYILIIT
jgi:hypothetical protein